MHPFIIKTPEQDRTELLLRRVQCHKVAVFSVVTCIATIY